MINYRCPRCKAKMSSPTSMGGHSELCPECEYIVAVPHPLGQERPGPDKHAPAATAENEPSERAIRIAKAIDGTASVGVRAIAFCKRRRKTLGIVMLNVVLLTGFLGWLLPDWFPRPELHIVTPARGLFAPRPELSKTLSECKYFLVTTVPEIGVLRGRRLMKYRYVKDVNYPSWAEIDVWCPLEGQDQVLAISTEISSPTIAKIGGAISGPEVEGLVRQHSVDVQKLFRRLAGIDGNAIPVSFSKETSSNAIYMGADRGGGFELERIEQRLRDSPRERQSSEALLLTFILKDKSWQE